MVVSIECTSLHIGVLRIHFLTCKNDSDDPDVLASSHSDEKIDASKDDIHRIARNIELVSGSPTKLRLVCRCVHVSLLLVLS